MPKRTGPKKGHNKCGSKGSAEFDSYCETCWELTLKRMHLTELTAADTDKVTYMPQADINLIHDRQMGAEASGWVGWQLPKKPRKINDV